MPKVKEAFWYTRDVWEVSHSEMGWRVYRVLLCENKTCPAQDLDQLFTSLFFLFKKIWERKSGQEVTDGDFPDGPVVKTSPSNTGGAGSIPGWGAKIPHASWPENQNVEQKQYCNKFNKDFKNGPHQKNLKKTPKPQLLKKKKSHRCTG